MSAGWREHVVRPYEDGHALDAILAKVFGLRPREIEALGRSRGVRVNGRPASLTARARHADTVSIRTGVPTTASGLEPTPMPLAIVHEDSALIVLDKSPYVLVHPTEPGQAHTLANGLAHYLLEQGRDGGVHPVHRLDRDTSGLIVFAATAGAHRALAAQIADRSLKREYLAIVSGVVRPDAGTIDVPIGAHPSQPALRAVRGDGDPARTHYSVVERFTNATLVALRLETGRTHQIRVHMTHLGHPLLGDPRYGRRGGRRIGRQALHAARLALRHPANGDMMTFEAPLPADMVRLRDALRSEATAG